MKFGVEESNNLPFRSGEHLPVLIGGSWGEFGPQVSPTYEPNALRILQPSSMDYGSFQLKVIGSYQWLSE